MARRLQFIVIGILAGVSFWRLSELPWDWRDGAPFLSAAVLALCFFGGLLAMLGALGLGRALLAALAVSVPAALLVLLKARDFDTMGEMLTSGHAALALIAVAALPVPFALSVARRGWRGWNDYPRLFSDSWAIVVRYGAAWAFVALVWLVLWLMWSLLDLAGVSVLRDLLTRAPVAWIVSGAVMGLGLAVVTELGDLVSPDLLLRLLRLLLPLVLAVEAVFVAVLPASGLVRLFGLISPMAVLIATAVASVTLVTIAVDRDEETAARAKPIDWSARGLALLLPVLVGLAGWSLWLRVAAHGWTPGRVGAGVLIAVLAGYGLCYAGAVLAGQGWRSRIRRTNVAMAVLSVVLGVLWLTPILSAERISVHSQIARYALGASPATDLPLAEFAGQWGRPGQRALEDLRKRAAEPGQEALAQALAQAAGRTLSAPSGGAGPEPNAAGQKAAGLAARVAALRAAVAVEPRGQALPQALLERIAAGLDMTAIEHCRQTTPAGNPSCLVVIADFSPLVPGRDAIFVRGDRAGGGPVALHEGGSGWDYARLAQLGAGGLPDGAALIDALIAGGGATVPAGLRALSLGAQQISVLP